MVSEGQYSNIKHIFLGGLVIGDGGDDLSPEGIDIVPLCEVVERGKKAPVKLLTLLLLVVYALDHRFEHLLVCIFNLNLIF